jgi:dTDP-4-dehydrorhamnose 3,5-epimerase
MILILHESSKKRNDVEVHLIIKNTLLDGVKLLVTDRFEDFRGELGGVYDEALYHNSGLTATFVYDMVSFSFKNVLRGMHGDKETTKLVQCLHGTVYAVILNCCENSSDFGKWQGFILSDKNHHQLYIPPNYGSSYCVLTDNALFHYKMTKPHSQNQFTYRWNDPIFNIEWPIQMPTLSSRDKNAPLCE